MEPSRLCCSCPRGIDPGWSQVESKAPQIPPAHKPLSSAHCRCRAGLILVQIRCVRFSLDNSPFLRASSGDCGKYVALIDR